MPDSEVPRVPWATLRQAVLWVAKKLPPIEERFESLLGYPLSINSSIGLMDEFLDENDEQLKRERMFAQARSNIARSLMLGKLQAQGHRGIETSGSVPIFIDTEMNDLDHYKCVEHESEYSYIPKQVWHP